MALSENLRFKKKNVKVNPISFPIKIAMQGLRLRLKTPFLTHLHMSLRLMEVDHADCGQDFCPADLQRSGKMFVGVCGKVTCQTMECRGQLPSGKLT